jgi:ligand-binding SRPBCC domain-containing protein
LIELRFESKLHSPRERVWAWITSLEGISAEMWPFFRMTVPRDVRHIADVDVKPGTPLFRSYILLFGLLPIDYSDLTLVDIDHGRGFVEESPMGSMRLWRHERRIVDCPADSSAVLLIDRLTFEPRWARPAVGWFIRRVFEHRHKVLRDRLDATPDTRLEHAAG